MQCISYATEYTTLAKGCQGALAAVLVIESYTPDTRSRNRRQKTGVGFWRQFFTPVAKFLAPETNTDE